jgi:hypothetical protein
VQFDGGGGRKAFAVDEFGGVGDLGEVADGVGVHHSGEPNQQWAGECSGRRAVGVLIHVPGESVPSRVTGTR